MKKIRKYRKYAIHGNLAVEAGHNEYEAPAQGVYIVRIAGKSHKLVVRN